MVVLLCSYVTTWVLFLQCVLLLPGFQNIVLQGSLNVDCKSCRLLVGSSILAYCVCIMFVPQIPL
jgi:hypothetical protein